MSWKDENDAPRWLALISEQEDLAGIPAGLLARMAYQESHFRPEIIDGTLASAAGALGILQLMPQFFKSVLRPIPFSAQDVTDQIQEAARELVRLYHHFHDFGLALAGYNWGQGHIDDYLKGIHSALPVETQKYVIQILADVPLPTSIKV